MALTHLNSVCAGLVLSLIRMIFRRSSFCTPFQFKSSYLIESLRMALRLESESNSTIRLSVSFCLSCDFSPKSFSVFCFMYFLHVFICSLPLFVWSYFAQPCGLPGVRLILGGV